LCDDGYEILIWFLGLYQYFEKKVSVADSGIDRVELWKHVHVIPAVVILRIISNDTQGVFSCASAKRKFL
jgi:hypothetical protein